MISITQNKNLSTIRLKEIVDWHWEKVDGIIKRFPSTHQINHSLISLETLLTGVNIDFTFEYIIKAPIDTLEEIRTQITKNKQKSNISGYVSPQRKTNAHFFSIMYETYREKHGEELIEKLGLTVCPYCNRNYINNGKEITTAELDHFFYKADNPIFALSFFNLIPCCHTCNHKKGKKKIEISPYMNRTTDKLLRFSFIPKSITDIDIEIETIEPKMKSNIEKLHLKELYQCHKDLVYEIIHKSKIYNDKYIKSIFKLSSNKLDMSCDELYYGNYLSEDSYYKRPLSKFTKDIIDEVSF